IWLTFGPTLLHSSTSQVARYLNGWSTSRFKSSKLMPSAPASFSSRFASIRDFSISGQNPASCSNSSLVAANGEPGKTMPPTVRIEPGRLFRCQYADDRVEIRQPLVVVVRVAFAADRLAGLVAGQFKRAGAHDVLFEPARILVEDVLLVDEGERVGERRYERAGREFEAEHDGLRVGRLDLVDHHIEVLPGAGGPRRRIDDLLPAGGM